MTALVRIARRNAWRHWRRGLSAVLAVAAGLTAVGLFQGFMSGLVREHGEAFKRRFMLGDVIVQRDPLILPASEEDSFTDGNDRGGLEPSDQRIVEDFLGAHAGEVEAWMRFVKVSGMINNGSTTLPFKGYGVDVARGVAMRGAEFAWNALAGVPLQVTRDPTPLLVGRGLGELLSCQGGGGDGDGDGARPSVRCDNPRVQLVTMTSGGQVNAADMHVVGFMDSGFAFLDRIWVNLPIDAAQRLLDTSMVSMYTVSLHEPASAEAFSSALVEAGRRRGVELTVMPWQRHPLGRIFTQITGLLGVVRGFMITVVAAVGAMAVANTFFKLVSERTREIGTLRSMGYMPGDIVVLFMLEGVFLFSLAAAVGLVATLGLGALINVAGIRYSGGLASLPIPLIIDWKAGAFGQALVAMFVVALAAVWLPARRAARVRIVDALTFV